MRRTWLNGACPSESSDHHLPKGGGFTESETGLGRCFVSRSKLRCGVDIASPTRPFFSCAFMVVLRLQNVIPLLVQFCDSKKVWGCFVSNWDVSRQTKNDQGCWCDSPIKKGRRLGDVLVSRKGK